jgi:hypothetical protein
VKSDEPERKRIDATSLLVRALRKVAQAEGPEKLRAACGQSFFAGNVFAQEGGPAEVDVLRALGRSCLQVGLWAREHIADQLREAFRAGQARGLKENLQP